MISERKYIKRDINALLTSELIGGRSTSLHTDCGGQELTEASISICSALNTFSSSTSSCLTLGEQRSCQYLIVVQLYKYKVNNWDE